MFASTFTWAAALCLTTSYTVSGLPFAQLKRQEPACSAVHIFLARGNNEPYPGRQGTLTGAICYGLESCDYEDIQYEAPVDSAYCEVVSQGDRSGRSQMEGYAARCPDSQLVLSGYSQGANVVGDLLGGSGGVVFDECTIDPTLALDPAVGAGSQLAAILLFGDVQHVAGQSYNVLNGSNYMSSSPRPTDSLNLMNRFSSIMRSYCSTHDPICATESPDEVIAEQHLNYFQYYSDDAAGWVKSILA